MTRTPTTRPGTLALFAIVVAMAAIPTPAQDAFPPPSDGWVTDLGGFLSADQERTLEALMESYRQGSGHEIALLTVPDLGGRSLERYALEVARDWGIGDRETSAGALLLVTRAERKVRIEVGRGLEGNLTDSISGRIIRNVVTPAFRQGRFYAGIRDGIEAMHAAAGGEYAAIPEDRTGDKRGAGSIVPLIVFLFVLFQVLRRGGRGGGRGSGVLPWLLLGSMGGRRSSGWSGGGGGGFGGFGGGGGFSGGGASGGW